VLYRAFAVPLMFCRPGIVGKLSLPENLSRVPGVTSFGFLLKEGMEVRLPENSVQRAAYAVIHGQSPADVNRILRRIWVNLKIPDLRGRQLLRNTLGYALSPLAG
jgi:hypothetical protein